MKSMRTSVPLARRTPLALAITGVLLGLANPAAAFSIDSGVPDLKLTWDNTLKYSDAFRVKRQDPTLTSNINLDDGDRNFRRGLISNRLDLLSEFDIQYQNVGARFSGAAWYDEVYNQPNDNPGGTQNQASISSNEFTTTTRNLQGRKAEMLDAFVFGRFDVADAHASVRLGQHSLVWGESLFFGNNAIAGAMSPVDYNKLLSVPGTQFKEAIRPVPQVSGQLQLTSNLTVGAYYQFRFVANRLPAVGSYFSPVDVSVDGAERLLFAPGFGIAREADLKPKDSGQGGVQLRWRAAETDFGFYAIRFHNKSHEQVLDNFSSPAPGVFVPGGYYLAYQEGTKAFGLSASHSFDNVNVAAEASIRTNQELASTRAVDTRALVPAPFRPPANDNTNNPAYAVGRSAHVNVSALWSLEPSFISNEGTLAVEFAWNRALSCEKSCTAIDANATRDASMMRLQFEPVYRQAISGWDISLPMGFSYSPKGSRSESLGLSSLAVENGGDMSVGINGTYLDVWRFTLAATHFYGASKPVLDNTNTFTYGQSLKDRDFVAFSLRRTF